MFRNLFPVLFDPDERPGGGEPAPVAPPAPTPPANDAPWSADLAGLGLDDTARAAVDGYLRQTWQPRMTQYEQQVRELAPAQELWKDFHEDPDGTFIAVGSQLFGEDKVDALQALLAEQQAAAAESDAEPTGQLDPRLQALLDEREAVAHREAYENAISQVKAVKPDLVEEWFHPFVVAAEGHMDDAVARYDAWLGSVQSKLGAAPPAPADAPATLGGGSPDGPAAPPVAETYGSLDDALDATLAEMRRGTVAPVGTV